GVHRLRQRRVDGAGEVLLRGRRLGLRETVRAREAAVQVVEAVVFEIDDHDVIQLREAGRSATRATGSARAAGSPGTTRASHAARPSHAGRTAGAARAARRVVAARAQEPYACQTGNRCSHARIHARPAWRAGASSAN